MTPTKTLILALGLLLTASAQSHAQAQPQSESDQERLARRLNKRLDEQEAAEARNRRNLARGNDGTEKFKFDICKSNYAKRIKEPPPQCIGKGS